MCMGEGDERVTGSGNLFTTEARSHGERQKKNLPKTKGPSTCGWIGYADPTTWSG